MTDPIEMVRVEDLKTSPGIQARSRGINTEHVRELVEVIRARPEFVAEHPLVGTKTATGILVLDGEHRLAAYKTLKIPTCPVRLVGYDSTVAPQKGWGYYESFRWNRAHGLTLTKADRQRAARYLLREMPSWSIRRIAGETGLAVGTVAGLKKRGVQNEHPASGDGLGIGGGGPTTLERAIRFFLKIEDAGEWKVLGLFGGNRAKLLVDTVRSLPREKQEAAWRVLDAWVQAIQETRALRRVQRA
jgi:ParB-like chromosome segregation protein Spo0J